MKLPYVMGLLGVAAAIGAAALAVSSTMPSASTTVEMSDISIPMRHTMGDLLELPEGISYDDAARALRVPGHAESRRAAGLPDLTEDDDVLVYAWPNPDGSRIVLVFRDDRLIHKAQVGLR